MKRIFSVFLSLLCALLMTGCSLFEIHTGSETPGEEPLSGSVNVGIEGSFSGQNLLFSGGEEGDALIRSLIHGCSTVALNEEGSYTYNKDVVKKMTWTEQPDGGRSYIFELKDDLFFSDGSPITARDYIFGILLQSSPGNKVLGGDAARYQMVVGHEDYMLGITDVFTGVKLLSEYKFSLDIAAENLPYFYEYLAIGAEPYPMHAMAPEAALTVSAEGAKLENFSRSDFRAALTGAGSYNTAPLVTSGPYTFVSYLEETGTVILTANSYYSLANKASAKVLTVKGGIADMVSAINTGLVDVAYNISNMETVAALQALQLKNELQGFETVSDRYYYLSFEPNTGITADLSVRKAAAYSVDNLSLAAAVTGSADGSLTCFAHPKSYMACTNADELGKNFGYGYSVQLAEEILADYETPTVALLFAKEDAAIADFVKASLTAVGFTVVSSVPEDDPTCGVITLQQGEFVPGIVAGEGGDPLLRQQVTEVASTQMEYYTPNWLAYQQSLQQQLYGYPLFCTVDYSFFSGNVEFILNEENTAPLYGLSSAKEK